MKWIWIAVGTVVVVVALAALIGAMLPQSHKATRKARYRQPPEALYAVIAGPPDWRNGVKAHGALPDGRWWEQDAHNNKIAFELVEDRPPNRRTVRIAGKSLPFGGTWTFDITPETDGASLRITENGEIYNVIFRFMARFFFGYTRSMEDQLRDLGRKFGETVRIEE